MAVGAIQLTVPSTHGHPVFEGSKRTWRSKYLNFHFHSQWSSTPEIESSHAKARAAGGALTVDTGAHVWDLARLGWALRGDLTTTTVPIGEFTSAGSGAVVVWDSDAAGRLFDALATDKPIPADVLDTPA